MGKGNGWHKPANHVQEVVAKITINGTKKLIVGPEDKIRGLIPEGACIVGYDKTYIGILRAKKEQQLTAAAV